MSKLFLLRHAKTESNNPAGDQARELTDYGIEQASEVGKILRSQSIQLALCSTATRARQTFAALGIDQQPSFIRVEYQSALYSGGADTIKSKISEVESEIETLLVVGHAPAIPALSAELAWESDRSASDQLLCRFPTATLAAFEVDGSWQDLANGQAKITFLGTNLAD